MEGKEVKIEEKKEEKEEYKFESKIDMKIYDVDKKDAIWFKQFCSKRDVRMNVGFKLLRILTDYAAGFSLLAANIEELRVKLKAFEDIDNEEVEEVKEVKTFGSKKKKEE